MNLEINEVSKMVLISAVDIPIVMENNLMCEELIIDVPLVMEPVQWRECCIYKVPKMLRQVNKEAYTPKLISIGPFHHGEKDLRGEKELRDEENENVPRDIELLKVRYLKDLCYRTGKCQKEIARIIEENEVKIRHCYAEISKLNSEDFVKMVLLDSTFIIELFLRKNEPFLKNDAKKEDEKDYILSKPWLEYGIEQDLMLLENQLPFFILKDKLCPTSVDDATEIRFRNLMALEQCHYPSESHICDYIMLLDYLINTREDVELFVENKIIINLLGSNEDVATMVNNLGHEIFVENHSYYGEMAKKLNEHYENCYNHNMGTLTSTYFSNLWRGTLTVVGLVVFGLSIWSTIKPFLSVKLPIVPKA
nr:uncharacterized protein LOC112027781 [Quercus suber]